MHEALGEGFSAAMVGVSLDPKCKEISFNAAYPIVCISQSESSELTTLGSFGVTLHSSEAATAPPLMKQVVLRS